MSIFFDLKYNIVGEDVPIKKNFKDVIFVLEDVDAASKVVKRRGGKGDKNLRHDDATTSQLASPQTHKSLWRIMLECHDSECRELVKALMEISPRLKEEATKPEVVMALSSRMAIPGLQMAAREAGSELDAKTYEKAVEWVGSLV